MVDLGEIKKRPWCGLEVVFTVTNLDGTQDIETCSGAPDAVAAWMRAVAERLSPAPKPATMYPPGVR